MATQLPSGVKLKLQPTVSVKPQCVVYECFFHVLLWLHFRKAQGSNGIMACQHLMESIDTNDEPVVLKNMIADWPASSWTPDSLHTVFKNEPLTFRIGNSCYDGMT